MLNQANPAQTLTFPVKKRKYSIMAIFWIVALLLAVIQAWANRYTLSSEDVISYLDIGDAYLRGDWNNTINGYWSPLYPWLLALSTSILKPSTYWEFPVVKLVNILIYLFTIGCFDLFLRELILYYSQKTSQDSNHKYLTIPEWVWLISGYTLFLWSSIKWTPMYSDAPDMCVAGIFYLVCWIVLRLQTRAASWFNFISLGVVLGFGYLAKAAMFPLALVFLLVASFSGSDRRQTLSRVLISFLIFTIIVSPFIAALSISKGRFTFGDNGKLNYVFYVNPGGYIIPDHHWQGELPGSGTPKHPTRKIFDDPQVFEFATPLIGTYPIWYDPSYWYDGLKVNFNLKKQIILFKRNTIHYLKLFLGWLVFVYLVLICASGRFWLSVKALKDNWIILLPAAAGLGMYMLVTDIEWANLKLQPSTRYIAPFIVILFAGVFSSLRLPDFLKWKKLIAGITIVVATIVGCNLSVQASQDLVTLSQPLEHVHWQIASVVQSLGIQPGDKVAVFADEYEGINPHVFWARLARVKIVAEIPDGNSFWDKPDFVRSEVLKTISKTGAKIILHLPKSKNPDYLPTDGWVKISNTGYYAHLLQE